MRKRCSRFLTVKRAVVVQPTPAHLSGTVPTLACDNVLLQATSMANELHLLSGQGGLVVAVASSCDWGALENGSCRIPPLTIERGTLTFFSGNVPLKEAVLRLKRLEILWFGHSV